jgi:UDP-N-acetylmuramoylalanine--D-glutamate ligase
VLEVSSFQLETTEKFRPEIAVILNVTPDHLDRHITFENYVAAKERIFARQTAEDALVLNWDDPVTRSSADRAASRVFWFSRVASVERGAFVEDGEIVFKPRKT